MTRMFAAAAAGLALLTGAEQPGAGTPTIDGSPVREIPDPSLRDVAVAVFRPGASVVYYNPDLLGRSGPDLAAFFMAHERAHLALRHIRVDGRGAPPEERDRMLRRKELDADCLATRHLAVEHPTAVRAAVQFFSRLGNRRFDTEHPTGAERAAFILACLPA